MTSAIQQLRSLRRLGGGIRSDISQETSDRILHPQSLPALARRLVQTPHGYLAPEGLPDKWVRTYEKRAAELKVHHGYSKEHAEAYALKEAIAMMGKTSTEHGIERS